MARPQRSTQSFSVNQAASFSGLSLAMVNYLCREAIVVPSDGPRRGRGVQRLFSFGDIVVLRAIARLLEGGVSVYRLRSALKDLRVRHPEITVTGMPAAYLVTDGRDVLLHHRNGVIELLRSGQFSFAFVVEMESVRKEAVTFARSLPVRTLDARQRRAA